MAKNNVKVDNVKHMVNDIIYILIFPSNKGGLTLIGMSYESKKKCSSLAPSRGHLGAFFIRLDELTKSDQKKRRR